LHDHALAGTAGVFGPAHHQDPELGRHDIQTLRDILADAVQRACATRADHTLHVDHGLDARQVGSQSAPVRPALGRTGLPLGGCALLCRGVTGRLDLLDLF
jgi:hypothetical protein